MAHFEGITSSFVTFVAYYTNNNKKTNKLTFLNFEPTYKKNLHLELFSKSNTAVFHLSTSAKYNVGTR